MKQLALGAAIALASLCAHAQEERPLHFVLGTGLTFGGETLANVTYSNGDEQDIRSGGLYAYYAGLDLRLAPAVSMQATLGYHADSTSASNGSVRFTRVPFELLGYYHVNDRIRVGGGVRVVNNPHLRGRGAASNITEDYENTVGGIVEGEYFFTRWFGLKVRGVAESYKSKSTGIKANGDHVGVYANFYF